MRPLVHRLTSGALGLALATGTLTAAVTAVDLPSPDAAGNASPAAPLPADAPGQHDTPASELDYVVDSVDVRPARPSQGDRADVDVLVGHVFHDRDQNGRYTPRREPGIENVRVSNGRDVVLTDADGRYELPVLEDMSVFVTKPANYAVPTDEDLVPQMAYEHKPAGSPGEFRFGGLDPTGPLPAAVNFPMVPAAVTDEFSCIAVGDTQAYSGTEVGYVRDSIATDLLGEDLSNTECMIMLGDVMGDDLGLLPRFTDTMATVGLPQYYVHGNHDFDFDATSDEDSADSWRTLYGPPYYSFDIGQVHFVVLDNVIYPCEDEDRAKGQGRQSCSYNGRVSDEQMEWLANDLAQVPEDSLVVLNHHIPFLSFVDNAAGVHQTDNLADIYELVGDRPALSMSGHTHTIENLVPGESYAGWEAAVGVSTPAFQHLVAGAASGNWYSGDVDVDGVPMALSRLGEPRGWFRLDFDGADYTETFRMSGQADHRQMGLGVNSPGFREWFAPIADWRATNPLGTQEVPPLSINDLPDPKILTPEELQEGAWLTANVWAGTQDTEVTMSVDGGDAVPMTRTQPGAGEAILRGPEYADPYAVARQVSVGRFALESASGNADAQGFQQFRGSQRGPASPQPVGRGDLADKSHHLWRVPVPTDLAEGAHAVEVTATDRHGRAWTDQMVVEVREERPDPYWRDELWD